MSIGISATVSAENICFVSYDEKSDGVSPIARCEFVAQSATLTFVAEDGGVTTLLLRDVKIEGRVLYNSGLLQAVERAISRGSDDNGTVS